VLTSDSSGLFGADAVKKTGGTTCFIIHVPMTKKGAMKIRLDGREDAVIGERVMEAFRPRMSMARRCVERREHWRGPRPKFVVFR